VCYSCYAIYHPFSEVVGRLVTGGVGAVVVMVMVVVMVVMVVAVRMVVVEGVVGKCQF
jgi:hypothetical protein